MTNCDGRSKVCENRLGGYRVTSKHGRGCLNFIILSRRSILVVTAAQFVVLEQ
jgi:hypothetical protein